MENDKGDIKEIRTKFYENLDKATDAVSQWPKWKQDVLGPSGLNSNISYNTKKEKA
ncbi:MAG: hypothetical protein P9L94_11585 [Candidatus Hinthialibacter antarcticus]|nr:hypothetical protein [Candidatus Hinthialibacter antarcticus]